MINPEFNGLLADPSPLPATKLLHLLRPLITQAQEQSCDPSSMRLAASGELTALEATGRSLAVAEGRLIEGIVTALARQSFNHAVLVGMKLPVLPVAAELARRNRLAEYSRLSVDPDSNTRTSYRPDLVLVDRSRRSAIVLDIKRSLGGYNGSGSLLKLRQRMEAAACVLPELLWRDHQRTVVDTVGIAIIDASRTCDEIDEGIWGLSRLDELLSVEGAGAAALATVDAFRQCIKTRWRSAVASENRNQDTGDPVQEPVEDDPVRRACGSASERKPVRPVTVGIFRPNAKLVH